MRSKRRSMATIALMHFAIYKLCAKKNKNCRTSLNASPHYALTIYSLLIIFHASPITQYSLTHRIATLVCAADEPPTTVRCGLCIFFAVLFLMRVFGFGQPTCIYEYIYLKLKCATTIAFILHSVFRWMWRITMRVSAGKCV